MVVEAVAAKGVSEVETAEEVEEVETAEEVLGGVGGGSLWCALGPVLG